MTSLVLQLFTRNVSETVIVWQPLFERHLSYAVPLYMKIVFDGGGMLYGGESFMVYL